MRKNFQRRFAFICRSMIWSALLYAAVMLLFNWEEVNNTVHGRRQITVVIDLFSHNNGDNNGSQKNISGRSGIFATATSVLRVIAGIASRGNN